MSSKHFAAAFLLRSIATSGSTIATLDLDGAGAKIVFDKGTASPLEVTKATFDQMQSSLSQCQTDSASAAAKITALEQSVATLTSKIGAVEDKLTADGSSSTKAAASCAEVKRNAGAQNGPKWLKSNGINSGNPFKVYCDFTIGNGEGFAVYMNKWFNTGDESTGDTGYERGPTHSDMTTSGTHGTPNGGYSTEFIVHPKDMPSQYNGGAGATKMAITVRDNSGSESGGLTSANNWKWVVIEDITPEIMYRLWTQNVAQGQYSGTFTMKGNTGRTDGSGNIYFRGSHGDGSGVKQWVAHNSANSNNHLVFEYKAEQGSDPNHFWKVDSGQNGATYWRADSQYNGYRQRWGSIALF